MEKRVNRKAFYRSEEHEDEAEDVEVVEKRINRKAFSRSEEDEDEAENVEVVEKRINRKAFPRSGEVEKRVNRVNSDDGKTGTAKGVNWIKPVVRSVYNNMAGIIEALKTRGFNSANFVLPAREVV